MNATGKIHAYDFLRGLEAALNSSLLGPTEMECWVRQTVSIARTNDKQTHLRIPEAAFLNGKAIPILFELLQSRGGLSVDKARLALLNESHKTMPEFSCHSPASSKRHPFRKILGASAADIYRGWVSPKNGDGLTQSCPDFALRNPFPHSIVFEGKYFRSGSLQSAQRQLAEAIYQAFFYRGLPSLTATQKHPEWAYEYACLMAYDASPTAALRTAWNSLPSDTQSSFWDAANIYVMILRGI